MSKTVLVTGASSGIGLASAKHFQKQGWNVIATMRSPDQEKELDEFDNILVSRLDVTNLDSISSAVEEGLKAFGKINVLVNNAGYATFGNLESFPRENILRQYDTNVIGLLDVTRAVLPHFRSMQDGIIINISSIGGRIGLPLNSLYTGTKYAVEGISEALRFEMGEIGVKVKLIEPGAINTNLSNIESGAFDYRNDKGLVEYQSTIEKVMAAFSTMLDPSNMSPASLVAETIFTAATDGSDNFRYLAGEDAKAMMEMRNKMDDNSLYMVLKKQFGL